MAVANGDGTNREGSNRERYDVSGVKLLGGYQAKSCPLRVVYDVYPPSKERAPYSDGLKARMESGNRFEEAVFERFLKDRPGSVLIEEPEGADRRVIKRVMQQATVDAMDNGAEAILGGWLPDDEVGRRTGKPDILVRAERMPTGNWAYYPVDVKEHQSTQSARAGHHVDLSALDQPGATGPGNVR